MASAQVIAAIPELGGPRIPQASTGTVTGGSAGTASSTATAWSGTLAQTDAMNTLQSESYGAAAIAAATADGVNPATLAAFGQVESHFQNVGNSSSSADGVWQITTGTWDDTVKAYGLPYTEADRSDAVAQADVASHIISQYSNAVTARTGQPATTLQTYGAYMFGPTAGSEIAAESNPSTPLSAYVSAKALANNGMSNWTVGQYYQTMASRMGSGASTTVRSA